MDLKPPIEVDGKLTPPSETTGRNEAPPVTNLSHGSSPAAAGTNPCLPVVKVDAKLIPSSQISDPNEASPVTKISHGSLLACSTAKNTSLPVVTVDETIMVDETLIGTLVNDEELASNPPTAFVPSIGAWAKPLAFEQPGTPPTPATPLGFDPHEWEKSKQDLSNEDLEVAVEKEQAQVNIASGHMVVQEENSEASLVSAEKAQSESSVQTLEPTIQTEFEEKQTQEGNEPNDLSMPANFPTYSKVTVATSSNFQFTSSPLAGTLPTLAQNPIMEGIPSPIIVSETNLASGNNSLAFTQSPIHDSLSRDQTDQQTTEQDDRDGSLSDATANLSMSRGGRPIKPLQKYQDMEWITIRGKGKRGRRGRGYNTS
ncbi:hypothetical protein Bca4012_082071 [Brassica carinata]